MKKKTRKIHNKLKFAMKHTIVFGECFTRQVPCDGATPTRDVCVSVTGATFSLVTRARTFVMLIYNSVR